MFANLRESFLLIMLAKKLNILFNPENLQMFDDQVLLNIEDYVKGKLENKPVAAFEEDNIPDDVDKVAEIFEEKL